MLKVSLNILASTSAINLVPMSFEFEDDRSFTNFIRESVIDVLSWNFETYGGQLSNTRLGVYIREDINEEEGFWEWQFIINCKNIREFKPYLNMNFEEFDSVLKSHRRDQKINDLYDTGTDL